MTSTIATTIRRYISELAALSRSGPEWGELDIHATAAIAAGTDLPDAVLLGLLERLAEDGPADIALRCGSGRRLAELGVVGHAIASCRTLGASLQLAMAHGAGSDGFRQVDYRMRGAEWQVDLRTAPGLRPAVRRLLYEEWIAGFFAHLAEVTQIVRPQVRIELDHAPAAGVDYARWLPARPVFGRRRCRLVLPASLLDQPLISYDHDMLQLILRHFAERPIERSGFTERVNRYLVLSEGQPPTLLAAAAQIGVSVRTLIRRLAEEGTGWRPLLEAHRRGYALALARDGSLGLKQIAAALGYRSEQSFKRAFVTWTGRPLGQWRREHNVARRKR